MSIPCYLSWCASVRRRMFWRMGIRRQSVFPFPVSEAMRACSSMERMAGRAACWTLVGRTYPHSARAATGGRGTQDRVKKGKFYKKLFLFPGFRRVRSPSRVYTLCTIFGRMPGFEPQPGVLPMSYTHPWKGKMHEVEEEQIEEKFKN